MPASITETVFKEVLEATKTLPKISSAPVIKTTPPITQVVSVNPSVDSSSGITIKPKHLLIAAGIGFAIWIIIEWNKRRKAEERAKMGY